MGCRCKNLDNHSFDVKFLVAEAVLAQRELPSSRLVRRFRWCPGASGRRELAMVDLAKDDGHKLMFRFRESKGYHEDAVDRKLLAHRQYASLSR